jgi:hypothetical protein
MHTSKMLLVPSDVMHKNDVSSQLLSSLDVEMRKILEDKSLPSDAKLAEYNQILHRYQKTDEERKQPFQIQVQEPEMKKVENDEHLLKGIPSKFKSQAATLVNEVKDSKFIKWGDDGEIVVDGVKITGSHIVDLIHDFSRDRKRKSPAIGAEAFARALMKSHAPRECIGNPYRHKLLEKEIIYATPASHVGPPQPSARRKRSVRPRRNETPVRQHAWVEGV